MGKGNALPPTISSAARTTSQLSTALEQTFDTLHVLHFSKRCFHCKRMALRSGHYDLVYHRQKGTITCTHLNDKNNKSVSTFIVFQASVCGLQPLRSHSEAVGATLCGRTPLAAVILSLELNLWSRRSFDSCVNKAVRPFESLLLRSGRLDWSSLPIWHA